jgi:hypothetical protein
LSCELGLPFHGRWRPQDEIESDGGRYQRDKRREAAGNLADAVEVRDQRLHETSSASFGKKLPLLTPADKCRWAGFGICDAGACAIGGVPVAISLEEALDRHCSLRVRPVLAVDPQFRELRIADGAGTLADHLVLVKLTGSTASTVRTLHSGGCPS